MINLEKERLSSSSYWNLEDNYHCAGDGRGGVGPRTTHFSSHKVHFGRDRHDGGFIPYQGIAQGTIWLHHWVVFCVVLNFVLVTTIVNMVWVWVPPTLPTRKSIVGLRVTILCTLRVGIIHPWVINTKKVPILRHIFGGRIIMVLMVMVEVVLILVQPTSSSKMIILVETYMMWSLVHISVSAKHTPWCNNLVGFIQIILQAILHLVLQTVMIKLVWALVPLIFTPIKMIFGLVVVILCHIGLRIIHKWCIQTKKGNIIHDIRRVSTILVFLAMVEVVLVLVSPTPPTWKVI